jgi:hypothetical protein
VANDGALEELISAIKGAGLSYKQLVGIYLGCSLFGCEGLA